MQMIIKSNLVIQYHAKNVKKLSIPIVFRQKFAVNVNKNSINSDIIIIYF
jgi:hypothetical protein